MIYMVKDDFKSSSIVLVHDKGEHLIRGTTMISFLRKWCQLSGCTFEGRREAASKLLAIRQKVPILISERTLDLFFPTKAMDDAQCVWINYRGIVQVKRSAQGSCIKFQNGCQEWIQVDYRNIVRELKLCERFIASIHRSKEEEFLL